LEDVKGACRLNFAEKALALEEKKDFLSSRCRQGTCRKAIFSIAKKRKTARTIRFMKRKGKGYISGQGAPGGRGTEKTLSPSEM